MRSHAGLLASVLLVALAVSACATDPSQWTEADWVAYNQITARGQMQAQAVTTMPAPLPVPNVAAVGQTNTTVTAHCNQLTDNLTTCRVR